MTDTGKKNYFKFHPGYQNSIEIGHKKMCKKYTSDLIKRNIFFKQEFKVGEIGYGNGNFAAFCHSLGIKKYIGIDIDNYYEEKLKELFPEYTFKKEMFQNSSLLGEENYDILFTSHIFEHLDKKERNEIIQIVFQSLKKGGIWINYMPNADAIGTSTSMRYCDITHYCIYNSSSFEQLIRESEIPFTKIQHFGDRSSNILLRIIHIPFRIITKIYFLGMLKNMPLIYSNNLISIITK